MIRRRLPLAAFLTFSAVLGLYVVLLTYSTAVGATWLPEQLNLTIVALLAVAVLCAMMAACASWLNEQAESRSRRTTNSIRWLDERAELRSDRELAWHRERTELRHVVTSAVYGRAVPPAGRYTGQRRRNRRQDPPPPEVPTQAVALADTAEWKPDWTVTDEAIKGFLDPPTSEVSD